MSNSPLKTRLENIPKGHPCRGFRNTVDGRKIAGSIFIFCELARKIVIDLSITAIYNDKPCLFLFFDDTANVVKPFSSITCFRTVMDSNRVLRSSRNPPVSQKRTLNNSKATKIETAIKLVASAANAKNRISSSRVSLTTPSFSTSNQATAAPLNAINILTERIESLESRLNTIEASYNQLVAENTELRHIVTDLQTGICQLQNSNVHTPSSGAPSSSTTSIEQQSINNNIVIRGVEVKDSTPSVELTAIYEGIRTHLGISDVDELSPSTTFGL
ncbi:hypothetical protein Bhyg_12306 [Pseudolycoriella hygida]|uniref:Uncharacterized protein n=1 Tax=Pseudolycoriella hygida TaxID=35572 RepID=A0A9Q0MYP8_9DIPT|nr:hypothetical protein Bhyg_12306 [Pseudolycoriella hygida]